MQHVIARLLLTFDIEAREVFGDVIGADGFLEVCEGAVGVLLLELFGPGDNVRERAIGPDGLTLEFEQQVAAGWGHHLEDRPNENEDNNKKFPKMAAIHGKRS